MPLQHCWEGVYAQHGDFISLGLSQGLRESCASHRHPQPFPKLPPRQGPILPHPTESLCTGCHFLPQELELPCIPAHTLPLNRSAADAEWAIRRKAARAQHNPSSSEYTVRRKHTSSRINLESAETHGMTQAGESCGMVTGPCPPEPVVAKPRGQPSEPAWTDCLLGKASLGEGWPWEQEFGLRSLPAIVLRRLLNSPEHLGRQGRQKGQHSSQASVTPKAFNKLGGDKCAGTRPQAQCHALQTPCSTLAPLRHPRMGPGAGQPMQARDPPSWAKRNVRAWVGTRLGPTPTGNLGTRAHHTMAILGSPRLGVPKGPAQAPPTQLPLNPTQLHTQPWAGCTLALHPASSASYAMAGSAS